MWIFETPADCDGSLLSIQWEGSIPANGSVVLLKIDGETQDDEFPGSMAVESETVYAFALLVISNTSESEFTEEPRITALVTLLDVPDLTERFEDLEITVAGDGLRIPLTLPFQGIANVLLTLQDTGDAVGIRVVDKEFPPTQAGPLIKAYDDTGTATTAIFDAVVIGW